MSTYNRYELVAEEDYYYDSIAAQQQAILIGSNMGFVNRSGGYKPTVNQLKSAVAVANGGVNIVEIPSSNAAHLSFDDFKPQEPPLLDISTLVLPPPNYSCYVEPPIAPGSVQYVRHPEQTITRCVTLNFNTVKTVIKENIVHHQHQQTVVTNVNRNHWHTQRVVVQDNNYHHYLINNVVKINDIHHQKIEHVRGESKTFKDYKQTQQVEAANCDFTDKDAKIVDSFVDERGSKSGAAASSQSGSVSTLQSLIGQASSQSAGQSTTDYLLNPPVRM